MEVCASHIRARYPTHATLDTLPNVRPPTSTGLSPSLARLSRQLRVQRLRTGGVLTPHFRLITSRIRFAHDLFPGLYRFRSSLLTASQLIPFPPLTKIFQFGGLLFPDGNAHLMMSRRSYSVIPGSMATLRLPWAYRSLARPSSAPEPSRPPDGVATIISTPYKAGRR